MHEDMYISAFCRNVFQDCQASLSFCVYTFVFLYLYLHVYMHIYMRMYMHIYMRMYMHMHMHLLERVRGESGYAEPFPDAPSLLTLAASPNCTFVPVNGEWGNAV